MIIIGKLGVQAFFATNCFVLQKQKTIIDEIAVGP